MIKAQNLRNIMFGACALLGVSISSSSHAAAVITFSQQGGDVVATGSGSIDLIDLQASFSGSSGLTAVSGQNAYAVVGSVTPAFDSVTFYTGASGPANFGTSSNITATTGSGDKFGIDAGGYSGPGTARIWISPTYINDSALSATDTWTGATFASLGLTPGVYTYSWGKGEDADTLQVRIGATSPAGVPEPATWAMMLTGFLGLGAVLRGARQKRGLATA